MQTRIKRLYRSRDDAQLAGVCAGLADYLELDPAFVRVVFMAATFVTGVIPGLLTYAASWLIVEQLPLMLPTAATAPAAPLAPEGN
jgi:phage shock protein C